MHKFTEMGQENVSACPLPKGGTEEQGGQAGTAAEQYDAGETLHAGTQVRLWGSRRPQGASPWELAAQQARRTVSGPVWLPQNPAGSRKVAPETARDARGRHVFLGRLYLRGACGLLGCTGAPAPGASSAQGGGLLFPALNMSRTPVLICWPLRQRFRNTCVGPKLGF